MRPHQLRPAGVAHLAHLLPPMAFLGRAGRPILGPVAARLLPPDIDTAVAGMSGTSASEAASVVFVVTRPALTLKSDHLGFLGQNKVESLRKCQK